MVIEKEKQIVCRGQEREDRIKDKMVENVEELFFFFQTKNGIRGNERVGGLGDVIKRQILYL
ncbi:hypothetical protein GSQ43_10055 [Clostridioides difficile]|uniref:hypothetical protein n=1 Tax=Clostridioides difficile TaxID=1496 RepID=UPI001430E59B|nr:hypothetical protein [Clostridioides difficile]NJI65766.1 hypothetical protein [Clostridioides difficile]